MEIRSKAIASATMKEKGTRQQELENEIRLRERKVDKSEEDLDNFQVKNENLVDIRQKKMEGVLLRSRARWVAEGENNEIFLERNFLGKQMSKSVAKNGLVLMKTKHYL